MNLFSLIVYALLCCVAGLLVWVVFWLLKPFTINLQNALGKPIVITGRGPLTIVGNIVGIPGKKAGLIWQQEEKTEKELLLSTFNYTCVGCGKRFWWGPLTGAWCYPCRNVNTESITIIGNIIGGSNIHYGMLIPNPHCVVIKEQP